MDSTFCDLILFEGDESKYKFEHVQDRIFVLSNSNNFTFFWLQDITTEQDEDLTQTIAGYVHHPASAYPAADTAADPPVIATTNSNTNTNRNTNTSSNTAAAAAATNDNLGNILESVRASSSTTAATTATTTEAATTQPVPSTTNNTTSNTTSQLTLADLQGAMAGLATSNINVNNAKTKLPLTEIATPEHLMECGILEDEAVTNKLISLLPEGQQTKEMLLQHLHLSTNTNPQVRSALQSLTAALASGPEGFHGVVMNFQLPLDAGNANLADNDPIQAFLDCLVAQVEREGNGDGDGDGDGEVKEEDDN